MNAQDSESGQVGRNWQRKVHRVRKVDVVVIGAGAAGVAAAVAAGTAGAKTLLVERYPVLGGTTTVSGVAHFQVGPDVNGGPIVRGHYSNVMQELHKRGVLKGRSFTGEVIKVIYLEMLERAGVDLLLHALFTDVETEDGRITGIAIETVSGLEVVEARVVIDASADGDVGAVAGAPFEIGRSSDNTAQPMTLYVTLKGVNPAIAADLDPADYFPIFERVLPHVHTAQVRLAYGPRFGVTPDGRLSFSMMHIRGLDGADADDLTRAEVMARKQADEIWQFFRNHVPGCENAILESTPFAIGIRETRRVLGDHVISRKDIVDCARFDDTIGRSNSFIDVHNPDGEGTLHEYVEADNWYDIPYRSLITRNVTNLFTVGRCMSATHHAMGSLREQPTCMVTGQAAGVGAALAARHGIAIRDIDITELHGALMEQGVDLGPRFEQIWPETPWFSRETGAKYGQPTPAEWRQTKVTAATGDYR